jgi:serine protease Do
LPYLDQASINQQPDQQRPSQRQKQANVFRFTPAVQRHVSDSPHSYITWKTADQDQQPNQPGLENYYFAMDGLNWHQVTDRTAGISLTPADDALRAHLKLPKDQGLIVTGLDIHSPAALAGVRQNDIFLKLENVSLGKPEDLEKGLKAAGDKPAPLTILRGGETLTIQVQPQVRVTMGPVKPEPPAYWIGVNVSSVEPALRSQLKLPQNQGLVVIEVMKDCPASKADVKVHDILLKLADKPLVSQEKLIEIVQSHGDKSIALELIRAGKTQTVEVTPERRKDAQYQVRSGDPRTYNFQFVRPGAVVTHDMLGTLDGKGDFDTFVLQNQYADQKRPQDAGASTKRLDEIDAEIKQLRKAIEELSKALTDKK